MDAVLDQGTRASVLAIFKRREHVKVLIKRAFSLNRIFISFNHFTFFEAGRRVDSRNFRRTIAFGTSNFKVAKTVRRGSKPF